MPLPTGPDGGRRLLQVTLGVLAVIPFASGLSAMLIGPSAVPGDRSTVGASLDSEYRFVNAFWFATGPLIWSTLPRVERETMTLRILSGTIFMGGIARLISWRRTGRPHPIFVAVTAVELVGVPALAVWQSRLAVPPAGDS